MSRWKRLDMPASRWGLATLALTVALSSAAACGGDSTGTGGTGGTGTTSSGSSSSTTGTGGTGGTVGPFMPTAATAVSSNAAYARAFDATLSNDGSIVYFTGLGPNGAGVFSVPASGGNVTVVAEGPPFAAPFGIALSTDGKKLYVADPGAAGAPKDAGRILVVDAESGMPTPVMGTDDILPRGLDIVAEGGADQIYFSGTQGGKAGLFKIPAAGGTVKELATGPLVDPEGVAVTKDGKVYVLDARGAQTSRANVYVYDGTNLTEFLADVRVGYPCGIALSLDEKKLIVSSLSAAKGASSLLIIDIFSKEPTNFPSDSSFDTKFEPGGLHRARASQNLAWVSYDAAGASVYLVK